MTANGLNPTLPYHADISFQAGDIVFATDRFGGVVYWNEEAEKISGYKADEVLGKPYTLACRMESAGAAAIDLAAILGGRDFAGGVRCHSRSGGDAALYLFATAGRNQAGEPAGVVFVGRDVTGLWRVEEAAQASADKYRVLFENTLDAVAIADMGGQVLEANPACLRLYGYTADDVKSMNLTDVVAPEDRGAAAEAMASLAEGKLVSKTIRMRRKDGTRFVVDLLASVMPVGGERRIMSVTRDVTERVRAEQARNQSERMYRAVFESANDAVFIESVDWRILDVNRNGCELLGYTRDELVKMSVSDLVPREARAWLPRVADAILRERTFRTEAVNVHKDGRHIPVEISASTMELDGRTVVLAIVRDISERKLAEQVLRESEEKFRSVSEQSPNMIFINSRGRVVYANQKSADVMGYTRDEFYAPDFDFMKLIAPESVEQIKAVYARHGRGEEVEPYEYTLVTKDGRRIESIITTKLVEYDGTKAILGIVTDITERKAGERALRESEEKYRSVVERATDGICVVQDGRLRYVNRRLAEMAGYEPEELVGKQFVEYLHPEDRAAVVDRYRRRFAGEAAPSTYPVRFVRRDGGEVSIEVNVGMATYEGAPAEIVLVRDVTERRRAEQALRESEDRYRRLLETLPEGVAVHQDGKVMMMNPAGARMLGYDDPAEVAGMSVLDFLHPDERAEVLGRMREVLASGPTAVPAQAHFRRRDGSYALLDVTNATLTWQGRPAIQVAFRDATERDAAERALRESEENFRALADNATDGVTIGDEHGRHLFVNRRAAEILGYPVEQLLDMTFRDYLLPGDRELLEERHARRLRGEEVPSHYEVTIVRRDGSAVPVEVGVSQTMWRGRPAQMVMLHDISERKRVERAIAAAEERYRNLVESSPDGIAVYQNGVVVLANRASAQLLGYKDGAELVGRTAASLVSPDDLPRVEERVELLRVGGTAGGPLMVRFLNRAGGTVPAEVVGAVTTWHGKPAVQVMVRPLSARHS